MKQNNNKTRYLLYFIGFTITLFLFWLIMSGHFTVKFLVYGILVALLGAAIALAIWVKPIQTAHGERSMADFRFPFLRLFPYALWLLKMIIIANIEVALIVLNPKLPIEPMVITFKQPFQNPLAVFTLANSITLTPGTITMLADEEGYTIHALTKAGAYSLYNPETGEYGPMICKVAKLYGEPLCQNAMGGVVV